MLLVTLANKPLVGDHLLDVLDVDEGPEDEESLDLSATFCNCILSIV